MTASYSESKDILQGTPDLVFYRKATSLMIVRRKMRGWRAYRDSIAAHVVMLEDAYPYIDEAGRAKAAKGRDLGATYAFAAGKFVGKADVLVNADDCRAIHYEPFSLHFTYMDTDEEWTGSPALYLSKGRMYEPRSGVL